MKKELGTPGATVGMLLLSCLFCGLALAIYPGWPAIGKWLDRADAPAWVQAVGSIGAIVATGWAVHWSHKLQERQRIRVASEEYLRLLEAVHQMVGGLLRIAKKISALAVDSEDGRIATDDVRRIHQELTGLRFALVQLDVTRLDRYALIEAVLVARSAVPPLLRDLEAAVKWSNIYDDTRLVYFNRKAEAVCEALEPQVAVLLEALRSRDLEHVGPRE